MTALRAPELSGLRGMPFLDEGFQWRRLLSMAAAARLWVARERGMPGTATPADAGRWLEPGTAAQLYDAAPPVPALPLPPGDLERVREVLAGLRERFPWWEPLTLLPVEFMLMDPEIGSMSASSRDWPQRVLLDTRTFATAEELREHVLHELAHQWLYFIEDIWPLEGPQPGRVTLPSGTPNRRPAEVLGAAHVAAVLIRLYATEPGTGERRERLAGYGRGCIALAGEAAADLTNDGRAIAQRLKEEF